MLAILSGSMLILLMLLLVFIIVEIIALWNLFKKAGRNGWESIVPFYSSWVLVEIAGLNWWWVLLVIINLGFEFEVENLTLAFNLCGFLGSFNCYYNVARRFGKDKTTSIFAGIFPFIFILIFGFSKNEVYDVSIPVGVNGIFSSEDTFNNNEYSNEKKNYQSNTDESTISVDRDNMTNDIEIDDDKRDNNKTKEYSFCGNCGTKLSKDIKYCPNCGKKK